MSRKLTKVTFPNDQYNGKNTALVRVGGNAFRCRCGCNCFAQSKCGRYFRCNSCKEIYDSY